MPLCGANNKKGGTCTQPAMANGRCRIHGGKSLPSELSPTLRTGRYAKSVAVRLAAKYEEGVRDPELLSVREDIALLDARIADVMASASNQESGELWQNLKEALREYDQAGGKNAEADRAEALQKIRWLIREGYAEWQSWKDIRYMLQERARLVEREEKRLVSMQQMMTTEDALTLIGRLGGILKRHISDRETLRAIAEDIRRVTG